MDSSKYLLALIARKPVVLIGICIIASAILSICAPLLTYGSALALFGIAHVVSELRYVDLRFGARVGRSYVLILGILSAAIIVIRTMMVLKVLPTPILHISELTVIVMLAMSPLAISALSLSSRLTTFLVAFLIAVGFLGSPTATILLLAVVHNLTPIGFIMEIVPRPIKYPSLVISLSVFVIFPCLIASGFVAAIVEPVFGIHQNFSVLPTGPIDQHLGVFLSSSMASSSWAIHGFSAIVFAQCMHYLAVIYVMPQLIKRFMPTSEIKPLLGWPQTNLFWIFVVCATGVFLIFYSVDFVWARSLYGIASAVHAYIEIPILLLAISPIERRASIGFPKVLMQR